MSLLPDSLPDAETQCRQLADLIRPQLHRQPALIGIFSGGVWIAERLRELLGLPEEIGMIDVSFYRDDFAAKGLHPQVKPTVIPFDVEGRHLILVDDVLFTGRTIRAALDALSDYGRPGSVELAVLIDRGHREMPIQPDYVGIALDTRRLDHVLVSLEGTDGKDEIQIVEKENP